MVDKVKDDAHRNRDDFAHYGWLPISLLVIIGLSVLDWLGRDWLANADNAALAIVLSILDWLRDNWFQSLAVLFMFRVWIGLSALTGFAERLYITFCNDDVAVLLRAVSDARAKTTN